MYTFKAGDRVVAVNSDHGYDLHQTYIIVTGPEYHFDKWIQITGYFYWVNPSHFVPEKVFNSKLYKAIK